MCFDSQLHGMLTTAAAMQELIEGVRGQGATSVNATLTFLDDELRITRVSPGNQCFVYKRVVV
jgi:hypothetical protein